MPKRLIPSAEGYAEPDTDGFLHAPAAARNAEAIRNLLKSHATSPGHALELASGTGQHVVELARALPHLHWQPSEVDEKRAAAIDARVAQADLPNLSKVCRVDATAPGWGRENTGQTLILLVNLLHLVSDEEAKVLVAEAALALKQGGLFVIYGPFKRAGKLTSEGDADFHAMLQAQDSAVGYKDDTWIVELLHSAGLEIVDTVEMPANNLALIARQP